MSRGRRAGRLFFGFLGVLMVGVGVDYLYYRPRDWSDVAQCLALAAYCFGMVWHINRNADLDRPMFRLPKRGKRK